MKKPAKKIDAKKVVLPHSQAKLNLYRAYLEHYLRVLGSASFCTKINLFDIFCGTGLYEDGNSGSPLIAVECIKTTQELLIKIGKPLKSITLHINDKEANKINTVKNLLESRQLPYTSYSYYNEDADDMLDIVINKLNTFSKTERNLVFIDPYGYSKIHKEKLQNILKNGSTEIILFLPVMQMYRFKSIALTNFERTCYENLRRFIFSFFPATHKIHSDGITSIFDFINEIKIALSFEAKFYTSSHYIERDKGNYYALFFITPNLYGLDKMMEVKWNLDPIKGKGFNQNKNPNQQSLFEEFTTETNFRKELDFLSKKILEAINTKNDGITNKEVYHLTLLNEFKPTHANSVLKELIKRNRIKPFNSSGQPTKAELGFGLSYKDYKEEVIKVIFK